MNAWGLVRGTTTEWEREHTEDTGAPRAAEENLAVGLRYISRMTDTRPEAEAVRRAVIMRRPPMERLHDALRMSEELREVALAALRTRHPDEPLLALVARLTGEPMVPGMRRGPISGR